MNKSLIVKNSITIAAPAPTVWDVLTNPAQTRKYMFGCEPVTDWKKESTLLWRGTYEGKTMDFVKGKILEVNPDKFLAYTTIDPNSPIPDVPENYLTVTYDLASENRQTVLTVTQGDYAAVADGEKRYQDTIAEGGWQAILEQIKKIAEGN